MPGVRVDDVTVAAVAEALRRTSTIKDAAKILDRPRSFIYDSLRRRRREWALPIGSATVPSCAAGAFWPAGL